MLEATVNDGTRADVRKKWTFVYDFTNGAWVRFNQVPWGAGYQRFRVNYGLTNDAAWRLEIHLNDVTGPLIGTVPLPKTDRARVDTTQIYSQAVGKISSDATGTHDVFLVFCADDPKAVAEFEYLRFEQYRGEIALRTNEVKLEVRVGSKEGEKIGEIYPRQTGGLSEYRDFVATLEPSHGKQPLFFVVHSALTNSIGRIDWIRLDKAADPIDLTGIGLPPREDPQGRLIFPEAANVPRSLKSE